MIATRTYRFKALVSLLKYIVAININKTNTGDICRAQTKSETVGVKLTSRKITSE